MQIGIRHACRQAEASQHEGRPHRGSRRGLHSHRRRGWRQVQREARPPGTGGCVTVATGCMPEVQCQLARTAVRRPAARAREDVAAHESRQHTAGVGTGNVGGTGPREALWEARRAAVSDCSAVPRGARDATRAGAETRTPGRSRTAQQPGEREVTVGVGACVCIMVCICIQL